MSNLSSLTDAQLTKAIQSSDVRAFKELFFRYQQPLVQFAHYRIQDLQFAEDIVQEIFIRVWNRREKLDADKSIKAYLYQIANRLIVDHFRKGNSRLVSPDDISYLADDMFITDNSHDIEQKELHEEFKKAIQTLPDRCRTIFIYSRFDNLKYTEIAEILDISIKTVENQMSKALQRLREILVPLFSENE